MKKRLIGTLLVLILAMTVIFAAGTKDVQEKDEDVTIKVFHYMTQFTKTSGLEEIQRQFSEIHPNVKFENIYYNQGIDYFPQLQTALNSGDVPEIIMGNPSLYPELIENGYAMNLNDNAIIKQLNLTQADLGDCSYKGNVYAFPVDYKTWGIFYNTRIFDELGIAIPKTASELIAASKKIEAAGYDVWADWYADGASVDIQTRIVVWTRAAQNGDYDVFEQLMSGKKKLADYPYMQESLEDWARRLQFNRNDALSNSQNQAIELFVSEQAALFYMGSWSIGDIEAVAKGNPNFEYDFFLCPISENPEDTIMNIQIDDSFMVNPKSKYAGWSQKFMEYWMTEGGITWSEITNQPLTSGGTSPSLSPVTQAIAEAKKSGDYVGYGEFTTAYTSEFTSAWRKGLTEWAENVIKGGRLTPAQGLANIQKRFDNVIATN